MQTVIVDYRHAIDKHHAAVITCESESVRSTLFNNQLPLILCCKVVTRRALPKRFLTPKVANASNYGLRVRSCIKIYLIQIAQRVTDVVE